MRENAATKGLRYLTEGRVIVTKVNGGSVLAYVRGDLAACQLASPHVLANGSSVSKPGTW